MIRNRLTERYLEDLVGGGRIGPGDLAAMAAADGGLTGTSYRNRCLTRPVFLEHHERERLEQDLRQLHAALTALPQRLFGGDLGAFARATGMTEAQAGAILRTAGQPPTQLARGDIYHDGHDFRLMEFNMGSALGGFDNAALNQVLVRNPALATFVADHQLSYVDTMAELARMLRSACSFDGERPLVAVVDWPESFAALEERLRASAQVLAPLGIESVPCHLGQLKFAEGRVWIDGRPVDLIYRLFMIEDVLDPTGPGLIDPVLAAVERGEVPIFVPMDAEMYGSKAALAMLSDEANRHLFSQEELASLDRLLPWTRMVRAGSVTVDGERVDLREFALGQQEDLVLKPTLLHGGKGVVLGWEVDRDEWRSQVDAAMEGAFVLQRRIRAVPELFPSDEGLEPWLLRWGVFSNDRGYGGAVVGGTQDLNGGALAVSGNAVCGCCFVEAAPAA